MITVPTLRPWPDPRAPGSLRVVMFSGGRGSGALLDRLLALEQLALVVAINGYDDGASTGEVRRFLGDALGPSDYRKNASRLAKRTASCPPELLDVLDARLPTPFSTETAVRFLDALREGTAVPEVVPGCVAGVRALPAALRTDVGAALASFLDAWRASGRPFHFDDCSVGNLVFAGLFLEAGRDFNATVDRYATLCGLPPGIIENVTDGVNAHLVAIDTAGRLLGSEAEIVEAGPASRVDDIFLIDAPLTAPERAELSSLPPALLAEALARREPRSSLNTRLAARLAEADLIVYAAGTQHSSLYPSYLTPGLGRLIASNLRARKILLTNLMVDAEIAGRSGTELVERAIYYLQRKGCESLPTPLLITDCLINAPAFRQSRQAHVQPGPVTRLDDLRLVRLANYEQGATGRHDSDKVLGPFLEDLAANRRRRRLAILLTDTSGELRLAQTLVELARGGLGDLFLDLLVCHGGPEGLATPLDQVLPFAVRRLAPGAGPLGPQFLDAAAAWKADYVALVDSSGMYYGEDLVPIAALLASGRPDAVLGSRRLSVREIRESYRIRYRHRPALGAISYLGSHLLSLMYLLLYGRWISDTLTEMRACRPAFLSGLDPQHPQVNHQLLGRLLHGQAEIVEVPVGFLPLSPDQARRTTVGDGLRALRTILRDRWTAPRAVAPGAAAEHDVHHAKEVTG